MNRPRFIPHIYGNSCWVRDGDKVIADCKTRKDAEELCEYLNDKEKLLEIQAKEYELFKKKPLAFVNLKSFNAQED